MSSRLSSDISDALRQIRGNATEIDIMVTPNAKADSIGPIDPWRKRITIRVQSLPQEGKANSAVVSLFKKFFNADAEISKGHTDRHKTVVVHLGIEDVLQRLQEHEEFK